MRIKFTIPYLVQPKNADRSRVVANSKGELFSHHYQPKKVADNAKALAALCAEYRPESPILGPIRLWLEFRYPWRKSEPKKNRHRIRAKDTKPDLDNLEKQLVDVLERSGFFTNDSQVAEKRSVKTWGEQGFVSVIIEEM